MSDDVEKTPVEGVSDSKTNTPQSTPQTTGDKPLILSMKVKLPSNGEEIEVKKLKAGSYYKAQQIYVDWLTGLQKAFSATAGGVNPAELLDKDGKPDSDKIEKELANQKSDVTNTVSLLEKLNAPMEKRNKIIAIGLGLTNDEFAEKFYPEDTEVLLAAVMKVNNFMGNLKKSVAPTGNLGA